MAPIIFTNYFRSQALNDSNLAIYKSTYCQLNNMRD